MCIDAKSVYDSITALRYSTPADRTMAIHVLAMREYLRDGLVYTIWWIDTFDMIADGMTKGSVVRKALTTISSSGHWQFIGDALYSTTSTAPPAAEEPRQ